MANNRERTIPRNLSECTKTSETVSSLYDWVEKLEKWGKIIFFLIIGIGLFVSIKEASDAQAYNNEFGYYLDNLEHIKVPSDGEVFFSNFFTWMLYAALEFCACLVVAKLVSALASITHSTMISSNVALYEANKAIVLKTAEAPAENKIVSPTGYVAAPVKPAKPTPGTWNCTVCGTNNKDTYGQCKKCGEYRK